VDVCGNYFEFSEFVLCGGRVVEVGCYEGGEAVLSVVVSSSVPLSGFESGGEGGDQRVD
jgi:hypothetical protein